MGIELVSTAGFFLCDGSVGSGGTLQFYVGENYVGNYGSAGNIWQPVAMAGMVEEGRSSLGISVQTTMFVIDQASWTVLAYELKGKPTPGKIVIQNVYASNNSLAVCQNGGEAWIYGSTAAKNGGGNIWRFSLDGYYPAGLTGNNSDPTFIAANSIIDGTQVMTTNNIQGLACNPDQGLAAGDGSIVWLFDPYIGGFTGGPDAGATRVSLPAQNIVAGLSFGPDGNLYILATAANGTQGQVFKYVFTSPSNPSLLISSNQINVPAGCCAMTVAGSETNPIVYVAGAGPTNPMGPVAVQAYDGNSGVFVESYIQQNFTGALFSDPVAIAFFSAVSLSPVIVTPPREPF
jgi:hypothetical protein